MTGCYIFKGYGATVNVDLPEDMGLDGLHRQVAPEVSVENGRGAPDMMLTRCEGVYHLTLGESRYGPYTTEEDAVRGMANGIHFLLGKRSSMTFLHAGAIELDGRAIVFPGRSCWGKSTLVASLVEQGCGYLSDEYAVVASDGRVHPLSKPIRLRRDGGDELRSPEGVSAHRGLPCAGVLLTRYERDAAWDPVSMTSGFALLKTLPTALQARDRPEQVLQALTAMIDGTACFGSARGHLEPTADMVRPLVTRTPSRQRQTATAS